MLTAEKKKYTVEDYMMLDVGVPFQLIYYDLVMSPSPTPAHQDISVRIVNAIFNFLESKNDLGFLVSAPMDVKFDDGNILQPDVLYVSGERKAEIVKERVEGAPDMVVEILSPSNAYYDLRQKRDIYEKYGVKEYIIVDPLAFTFESYLLKDGIYQLQQKAGEAEKLNSAMLPGLSFALTKLF